MVTVGGKRKSAEFLRKSKRVQESRDRESGEGLENNIRIVAPHTQPQPQQPHTQPHPHPPIHEVFPFSPFSFLVRGRGIESEFANEIEEA